MAKRKNEIEEDVEDEAVDQDISDDETNDEDIDDKPQPKRKAKKATKPAAKGKGKADKAKNKDKAKAKPKKGKDEDDEDEDADGGKKKRYFKRIYPKEGTSSGRYSKGPHQAGLKAFNQYQIKCEREGIEMPKSVKIYIQETTADSRHAISCYKCVAGEEILQKRLKPGGDPDNEDDYIHYRRRNTATKIPIDQAKIREIYREAVRQRVAEKREEEGEEEEKEKPKKAKKADKKTKKAKGAKKATKTKAK